jgi:hypothetical protein
MLAVQPTALRAVEEFKKFVEAHKDALPEEALATVADRYAQLYFVGLSAHSGCGVWEGMLCENMDTLLAPAGGFWCTFWSPRVGHHADDPGP